MTMNIKHPSSVTGRRVLAQVSFTAKKGRGLPVEGDSTGLQAHQMRPIADLHIASDRAGDERVDECVRICVITDRIHSPQAG